MRERERERQRQRQRQRGRTCDAGERLSTSCSGVIGEMPPTPTCKSRGSLQGEQLQQKLLKESRIINSRDPYIYAQRTFCVKASVQPDTVQMARNSTATMMYATGWRLTAIYLRINSRDLLKEFTRCGGT